MKYIFRTEKSKIKYLYLIQNNGTAIDNLIINLNEYLPFLFEAFSIKGLKAGINSFDLPSKSYPFNNRAIFWKTKRKVDQSSLREYKLKIFVNFSKAKFKICNYSWANCIDQNLSTGIEEDFYYNSYWIFKK